MRDSDNEDEGHAQWSGPWYLFPPIRNALLAAVIAVLTFTFGFLNYLPAIAENGLYAVAMVLGGFHWAREGIEELVGEHEIDIEILMLAATGGAVFFGLWEEAAILAILYGAAEGVEEYTFVRTRASIRSLLDLAPEEARLVTNGSTRMVPARELDIGDVFRVKPGESVPTDGRIVDGRSTVDQAAVTGESTAVDKREGDEVFAGSVNQEGVLEVEATTTFEDNTLSKMIHLVEEAQEEKGKSQLFIEKFGGVYSPLVLLVALGLMGAPFIAGLPGYWAERAIVLLVAAAPCALVMSTPIAIASGIGRAGREGVLVKGGIHLENLGKIEAIAFDKTGTLTRGEPVVTDVVAYEGTEDDVLRQAASVEQYSEHHLGEAIMNAAAERGIQHTEASEFSSITGYGAQAQLIEETVYVGKPGLFERFNHDVDGIAEAEELQKEGKTVVLVGTPERIMGVIALRDEPRPEAKGVIQELHERDVEVLMLTGDNKETAQAIATELGIDDVRADLKPEEKVEAVKELTTKYGAVAMVGDGINDAPALAQATVGIAMGTAGTDAAIEAADIALMADDITKVTYALSLGQRAQRISRQNIVFSLLVLAVLIPGAVLGVIGIVGAVIAHEGSELLAIGNGLRVRRG
ncbi:heavy metal translocating P-type ATPase [Natrialba sp. SSL1]|uniref:heavy metal translocating P-type ATPase n=2 Tax=cellular organisms TaxID=131567 RepID=UPI0008F844F5|nr:heavy metal translocating P-type ATPase [Natrialba sp. SSL1]OIB57308.1 ATPase [Natrialba sp. SSL1]